MFNNTKLDRAKKRRSTIVDSGPQQKEAKQRRTSRDNEACIFCDNIAPISDLRQARTMNLDRRLRECAQTLNDGKLLAILSVDDAMAQELKYHHSCLTRLYNRERSHLTELVKE